MLETSHDSHRRNHHSYMATYDLPKAAVTRTMTLL